MSEETLFTAARRIVRFMNGDLNHNGGIICEDTQKALLTLTIQVDREAARQAKPAILEPSPPHKTERRDD